MIPGMVAAIGVIVAATYYVFNIKNSSKLMETTLETRQAQLFMQVFQRFNEPDFFDKYTHFLSWKWKDYEDYISKYGQKVNPEAWYSEGSIAAFFNGVGLLLYMDLLDIKLIHGLLYIHIKLFWEKVKPVSYEMRERLQLPQIDEWVEYLYGELMEYNKKQPHPFKLKMSSKTT
jgi:hypothetical protein